MFRILPEFDFYVNALTKMSAHMCVWLCHMSLAEVQAKQILHQTPMHVYMSERFKWGV